VVADPAVAVAVAGYNGPVVHCFAGRSRGAATTAASDLGVWRYDSQSFLVNAAFQVFAANFDSSPLITRTPESLRPSNGIGSLRPVWDFW
jgi:hypothetical protein